MSTLHPVKFYTLQALAVLAYAACIVLWMMALVPYLLAFTKSDAINTVVAPSPISSPAPVATDAGLPQWVAVTAAVIILVIMIAVIIIGLWRAPKMIGRSGNIAVRKTTEVLLPVITHHHQIPPKVKKRLTTRIALCIKLAVVCVPIIALIFAPLTALPPNATRELLLIVSLMIGAWALALFAAQYVLARALRVPYEKLW